MSFVIALASITNNNYASNGFAYSQFHQSHYQKALKSFLYEYSQGDLTGAMNAGEMYENGTGVKKDIQKALHYYRQAACGGIAPAMTNIGYIYQIGEGVSANRALAIDWYLKAIQHGDALYAAYNLGNLYLQSPHPNFQKAHYYYTLSAQDGNTASMYKLGMMALTGKGEPLNHQKAYTYLYKASLGGDKLAQIELDSVKPKLIFNNITSSQQGSLYESKAKKLEHP